MLPLLLLLACGAPSEPAPAARTLTLAAYTTPREAYGQAILPAFAAHWQAQTGESVRFEASYQGSGAQARAVREGLEAHVAHQPLDVLAVDLTALGPQDGRDPAAPIERAFEV